MRVAHASRWRGDSALSASSPSLPGKQVASSSSNPTPGRSAATRSVQASTDPSRSSTLAPPSTPIVYRQPASQRYQSSPSRVSSGARRDVHAQAARLRPLAHHVGELCLAASPGDRGRAWADRSGSRCRSAAGRPSPRSRRRGGRCPRRGSRSAPARSRRAPDRPPRRSAATRTRAPPRSTWSMPNSLITSDTSSEPRNSSWGSASWRPARSASRRARFITPTRCAGGVQRTQPRKVVCQTTASKRSGRYAFASHGTARLTYR